MYLATTQKKKNADVGFYHCCMEESTDVMTEDR